MISFGYGSIRFCQAVDVHRNEVKISHLFKEVCRRRRCRDGDADWRGKLFRFFGCAEERINRWGGIIVCDILGFKQIPD